MANSFKKLSVIFSLISAEYDGLAEIREEQNTSTNFEKNQALVQPQLVLLSKNTKNQEPNTALSVLSKNGLSINNKTNSTEPEKKVVASTSKRKDLENSLEEHIIKTVDDVPIAYKGLSQDDLDKLATDYSTKYKLLKKKAKLIKKYVTQVGHEETEAGPKNKEQELKAVTEKKVVSSCPKTSETHKKTNEKTSNLKTSEKISGNKEQELKTVIENKAVSSCPKTSETHKKANEKLSEIKTSEKISGNKEQELKTVTEKKVVSSCPKTSETHKKTNEKTINLKTSENKENTQDSNNKHKTKNADSSNSPPQSSHLSSVSLSLKDNIQKDGQAPGSQKIVKKKKPKKNKAQAPSKTENTKEGLNKKAHPPSSDNTPLAQDLSISVCKPAVPMANKSIEPKIPQHTYIKENGSKDIKAQALDLSNSKNNTSTTNRKKARKNKKKRNQKTGNQNMCSESIHMNKNIMATFVTTTPMNN